MAARVVERAAGPGHHRGWRGWAGRPRGDCWRWRRSRDRGCGYATAHSGCGGSRPAGCGEGLGRHRLSDHVGRQLERCGAFDRLVGDVHQVGHFLGVEVEGGVATRVVSNFDVSEEHPGCGRVCVKAYGLIQKTYNPNRLKQPMKRTNPRKGRDEDPGFVPIGWDEALDTVAARLQALRDKGLRDESGYPRLAVTFGQGGTPARYMGAFPAG